MNRLYNKSYIKSTLNIINQFWTGGVRAYIVLGLYPQFIYTLEYMVYNFVNRLYNKSYIKLTLNVINSRKTTLKMWVFFSSPIGRFSALYFWRAMEYVNNSNKYATCKYRILNKLTNHDCFYFLTKRSFFRTVLMKGFHFLVWALCVRSVRDTQCGFKMFTRRTAQLIFANLHVQRW